MRVPFTEVGAHPPAGLPFPVQDGLVGFGAAVKPEPGTPVTRQRRSHEVHHHVVSTFNEPADHDASRLRIVRPTLRERLHGLQGQRRDDEAAAIRREEDEVAGHTPPQVGQVDAAYGAPASSSSPETS